MEDELYAEAVMVTDGIISKVGNFEYVMKFKDDGTSMYDLEGRTLMPSFIDPHSHITAFATTLRIADLSRAKSFAEIVELLKRFKEGKHLKADDWIMGFGYDHNQLDGRRHPDKSVLDEVLDGQSSSHSPRIGTYGGSEQCGIECCGNNL